MRTSWSLLLLVVAALAVAALSLSQAGAAAPERNQVIRMGQGIGKIRLGMTVPQVRRALGGRHHLVYRRNNFGWNGRYVEFGWERPGRTSWEPVLWQVGFRSWTRRGTLRVVRVITNTRSQRTAEGYGVGTRSRKVARAYPHATCVNRYGSPHPGVWIVVNAPSGTMTAFQVSGENRGFHPGPMFVVGVMVQERWFSKGRPPYHGSCTFNWRNW